MTPKVRTRIAPAPSGTLHVGSARTALYNWLFARSNNGAFVLRIEDTDAKRVTPDAYEGAMRDLRWLGLEWDEGPDRGGGFGPYIQSERGDRYEAATAGLLDSGHAYRCYCTPEEVQARLRASGRRTPGYDSHCRTLTEQDRRAYEAQGRAPALRFRVPEGVDVTFDDVVRGAITTNTQQIPDFVLQRSNMSPTYMLAAAVDDVLMDITHVIRGEDLLPATPRQILLRRAMAVEEVPVWAHLPLLVTREGRPLSKRWGDVSVDSYRRMGFLPEAMVNYLALLGWSWDEHTNIFSIEELVERFSLERVARNPAAFDVPKLEWLNGHYIRKQTPSELAAALVPFCVAAGLDADTPEGRRTLEAVAPLLVERLKRLADAPPMVAFLFGRASPDEGAAAAIRGNEDLLAAAAAALERLEKWTAEAIEGALRALADERDLKARKAFQPIRAATTGTLVSPPLFESLEILGREETLARLRAVS